VLTPEQLKVYEQIQRERLEYHRSTLAQQQSILDDKNVRTGTVTSPRRSCAGFHCAAKQASREIDLSDLSPFGLNPGALARIFRFHPQAIRNPMTSHLKIDFVSDISCPWCVIGLRSLEQALERVGDETTADIHFQPFELNPQMPPEGQEIAEHIAQKYGPTPEQLMRNQEGIRARGAALGFTFNMDKRARIYNTFDAHRLLHWAELDGRQHALKLALFTAYFTEGRNPSDREVLIDVATQAGLDPVRAREILESGLYADEVHEREQFYVRQGIHAAPSVIVNDKYLIQGGQPVEVFEQALRKIAVESRQSALSNSEDLKP
jgi:predicted DsbA family dithiol-disulfide isomerase